MESHTPEHRAAQAAARTAWQGPSAAPWEHENRALHHALGRLYSTDPALAPHQGVRSDGYDALSALMRRMLDGMRTTLLRVRRTELARLRREGDHA